MNERRTKKMFSHLFLGILYCKMLISIAPLVVAHLDPESINAVIMQLEIEDNSKPTSVKDVPVKECLVNTSLWKLTPGFTFIENQNLFSEDHAKHLQVFYPSVPTPPPNA